MPFNERIILILGRNSNMTRYRKLNYENAEVIQLHDLYGRKTQKIYIDYNNNTYKIINDNPRYDYYEDKNEDYE
jgi:hypothetical protein